MGTVSIADEGAGYSRGAVQDDAVADAIINLSADIPSKECHMAVPCSIIQWSDIGSAWQLHLERRHAGVVGVASEEGVALALSHAARSAFALPCGRLRHVVQHQHRDATAGVEAPLLELAGVDDVHDVLNRH